MMRVFLIIMIFVYNSAAAKNTNVSDILFTDIDGKKFQLSDYNNKLLLIVNTASECGFTYQYKSLTKLDKKYKKSGLIIIAIPSNDFGSQEPGNSEEIKEFVSRKFNSNFILTQKERVLGDNAHEFYKRAFDHHGFFGRANWNFHKYFVLPDGNLGEWFSSMTDPESEKIVRYIEKNLPSN